MKLAVAGGDPDAVWAHQHGEPAGGDASIAGADTEPEGDAKIATAAPTRRSVIQPSERTRHRAGWLPS
jgi:hypothetical protein